MAISVKRDNNFKPMLLGTSNADGKTVVAIAVNPTNHALKALDGSTGSNFPFVNAQRDANRVTSFWGVSSSDGVTPVPIYCDTSGNLLIKST